VPTEAILESIVWSKLELEVRRQKIIDRIRVESERYPQNGEELSAGSTPGSPTTCA
jgi:hypothetical protein